MGKTKVKAHEIKHALAIKHERTQDFFLTEVKNGSTYFSNELYIMDGLAIKKSWVNPMITGYEIKVSRNDFLQDEKWMAYKHYCHRLDFVCPTGLIKPEELPDDIGLIYYNPDKKTLFTRKKGTVRSIDLPYEMFYYIIMNRLENVQHPFFTDKQSYFEEYINNKISSKELGREVSSKLIDEVARLDAENKSLERDNDNLKENRKVLSDIGKVLRKHGLNGHFRWGFAEDIDRALNSSFPPSIERDLKDLGNISTRLLEKLTQEQH